MYTNWPVPSQPWQSNVMPDYHPPSRSARLRNSDDKPWRPQAEKSVLLYQQLITKFSDTGDTVADLFGGTFSSAIAAHSLGRRFLGCEQDIDLTRDAQMRVGRYLLVAKVRFVFVCEFAPLSVLPQIKFPTCVCTHRLVCQRVWLARSNPTPGSTTHARLLWSAGPQKTPSCLPTISQLWSHRLWRKSATVLASRYQILFVC